MYNWPSTFYYYFYFPKTGQWATFEFEKWQGREEGGNEHTHAAHSALPYVSHTMYAQPHIHPIHSPEQKLWTRITRGFCTCEGFKCSIEVEIVCVMLSVCCGLKKAWVTTHLLADMTLITAHVHTHTNSLLIISCCCVTAQWKRRPQRPHRGYKVTMTSSVWVFSDVWPPRPLPFYFMWI